MVAVRAAAVDVIEAFTGCAPEMAAVIVVPAMIAALIPERAVIAPIAIDEGAVIAVIITVIIIRPGRWSTDANAHWADLNAYANLRGCASQAQKAQDGDRN